MPQPVLFRLVYNSLSLRYTVGNKTEVSQFIGGRSATIKTYDPLLILVLLLLLELSCGEAVRRGQRFCRKPLRYRRATHLRPGAPPPAGGLP